ncbi:Nif11-like leader peptide family RiPP precursor [Pleurocapsa sp. FMAR1]|uniref:Nif11-like leader peptide family RiPP precursor n=1 Tax=Pleurocapsa sp. FMAR1 TaxID=3040204 RepID=UPI0029C6A1C7|nr:Nif11-like leader peptide family RiPP precursor [Pleurocapsa sp. FMAR1]
MSQQNALAFFTHVEQNPTLKQKVQTAPSKEELFNIAQEAGYSFSADDLKAISQESESEELNEQELEAVAGGTVKDIASAIVDTAKDVFDALW